MAVANAILTVPNAVVPFAIWQHGWYKAGTDYDFALEAVSAIARSTLPLYSNSTGVLQVSVDGGAWQSITDDPDTSADLGAFTAGERKPLTFRYNTSADIWVQAIELFFDAGIGLPSGIGGGAVARHATDVSRHAEDVTRHAGG